MSLTLATIAGGRLAERSFFEAAPEAVAPRLLGMVLAHRTEAGTLAGRIVEVEAYLGPHDLAAHTSKGLTERTRVMFGPPGHSYVYMIYGMHHCLNVVTEPAGHGAAVLLRALEPVAGLVGRTSGPGLLCRAMGIDRQRNGHDLLSADFFIADPGTAGAIKIVARPRIGVDYAKHWARRNLRFYERGNPFVSRP